MHLAASNFKSLCGLNLAPESSQIARQRMVFSFSNMYQTTNLLLNVLLNVKGKKRRIIQMDALDLRGLKSETKRTITTNCRFHSPRNQSRATHEMYAARQRVFKLSLFLRKYYLRKRTCVDHLLDDVFVFQRFQQ